MITGKKCGKKRGEKGEGRKIKEKGNEGALFHREKQIFSSLQKGLFSLSLLGNF